MMCAWCDKNPATTVRRVRVGNRKFLDSLDVCERCAGGIDRNFKPQSKAAKANEQPKGRS